VIGERRKGARGELEAIALIRDAGWPNARRTHDGRAQSGRGDVAGGPAGCHIEIKRVERLSVPKALSQLRADAGPLDLPILVHRPSRSPWMATLPLDELLSLMALRERG
jgi:hypothetical protein